MAIEIYPSVDGWITPRTDEVKVTDDNLKIILPKKINKITKVTVRYTSTFASTSYINVTWKKHGETTETSAQCKLSWLFTYPTTTPFEIDITKYIVEKQKYDTLDTESPTVVVPYYSDLYTNNTWYYTHNENTIELINTKLKSFLFTYYPVQYIIHGALNDLMQTTTVYANVDDGGGGYDEGIYDIVSIGNVSSGENITPRSGEYRVYYEASGESVKINIPKTVPLEYEFAVPFSQQQPVITSNAYGKKLQSTANRMGVEERTVKRKIKSLSDIRWQGTKWIDSQSNEWRLTVADFEYCNGYCIETETWSKNWTKQSEYVGVNREFRSWNIPNDIVQRNCVYEDYCFITDVQQTDWTDDSILSEAAKLQILRTCVPSANTITTECNNLFLKKVYAPDINTGVVLSCSAIGLANTLVFTAKTKDNLSAGLQIKYNSTWSATTTTCKDVYYTYADGTLDRASICIAPKISQLEPDEYPEMRTTAQGTDDPVNTPNTEFVLFKDTWQTFKFIKSPNEQLNFEYQVHFLSHIPTIIIGAGFTKNCPLVLNRETALTYKYWTLTSQLPKDAQTMTSDYGTIITTPTHATSGNYIRLPANYCITDANNDIILANNGSTEKTMYFYYTHNYKQLRAAYNAAYDAAYHDAINPND